MARSFTPWFLGIVAVGILALDRLPVAEGAEIEALVDGLLERAESVESGRLEYRVKCGVGGAREPSIDQSNVAVFWGGSLRLDNLDPNVKRVRHNGEYVVLEQTPQPDGSLNVNAHVHVASDHEFDNLVAVPRFAGSLWKTDTIEYVRLHRNAAIAAGKDVVDEIPVVVLEWKVPKEDVYLAFESINDRMSDGVTMRLYVAERLGHALPRIEYRAPDGSLAQVFSSHEFKEVDTGLYFPMQCRSEHFPRKGSGFYWQYEFTREVDVNNPIAEREFVLKFPVGTVVTDFRMR